MNPSLLERPKSPAMVIMSQSPMSGIVFANTETAIVPTQRNERVVYDVNGYYAYLGVDPHASYHEIRSKGRVLAKELHPDNGGDTEEFLKLQSVLAVLLDKEKREGYDPVEE